jgi:hypothetical protein
MWCKAATLFIVITTMVTLAVSTTRTSYSLDKVLMTRGGKVADGKRKKLSLSFMFKSFFSSMVDPTYSGHVEVPKTKTKGTKGKKQKLGSG